jgi:parallel beta-helix repeat protein
MARPAAYGQASDITIIGGIWDGNRATYATNCTMVTFGHAERISVRNVTFRGTPTTWHGLELNAVRHGKVINCTFLDGNTAGSGQAQMQIDLAVNSGAFPWFGPYDSTPCDGILVEGCTFDTGSRGIDTHSATLTKPAANCRIVNNVFRNMADQAIYFLHHRDLVIANNSFDDCKSGIELANLSGEAVTGFVLANNTFDNGKVGSGGRAVYIHNGDSNVANTSTGVNKGVINGNIVRKSPRHGIGVDYCEDWLFTNNQVVDNPEVGIYMYKGKRYAAIGNTVRGNASSDIQIGATSGSATDATDYLVRGNQTGVVRIGSVERVLIDGNVMTSLTTNGTPGDHHELNNYINGTWTP